MRKLISTTLVVMLVFSGCSQKNTKTTVLQWGTDYSNTPEFLKGNIKEVTQNTFWAVEKDGKIEKGALLTMKNNRDSGVLSGFHAIFDNSGKLISCDYFGDNQKINWSIANDFKDGKVAKENWIRNDTVFAKSFFSFDDKGFIDSIRMMNALADTLNALLVLTNDERGNFTRMDNFNSKGHLSNYGLFTIDEAGRVTKAAWYLPKNDTIQGQQFYAYNDHGFCDSFKAFDKTNKLVIAVTGALTYDDKGNWTRVVWSKNGKPWVMDERSYIYY
jgi:hypothetical protein